jgi:putative oxidoreductase
MIARLNSLSPYVLAILRIITGLLFVHFGLQKLFGFPVPFPVPLDALTTTAGVLELVGGALVTIGLFTRPAAFILSGMMAVGYWIGHAPMGFYPAVNMGTGAILFCFIYLYLVFAGPGAWSLDGKLNLPWR